MTGIVAASNGDEFIVVLSGCGAEEAEHKRVELQTAIDRIRRRYGTKAIALRA